MTCPVGFANNLGFFLDKLLTDLGIPEDAISKVLGNLALVAGTYETNLPDTTLTELSDKLYACLQPIIERRSTLISEAIGFSILYIVILTAIFAILLSLIFVLLSNNNSLIIMGLVIFFALMYILIAFLILHSTQLNISNNTSNLQNEITNCVNVTVKDLNTFETQQKEAINTALCSYPNPTSPPIL